MPFQAKLITPAIVSERLKVNGASCYHFNRSKRVIMFDLTYQTRRLLMPSQR